ncbi:MAG: DEAD/DEAH box helicase [Candidatus Diapherotrites archaeon]|uniref:DEAD/DEAH box helicase n=1 Tax=Candidatus Iainarchaeum sp. TaxID=3101447 RepID=A0A8T3YJE8_9ARCH|nr:DEAD/DEAH box helicase [Candidatus Diapherotrites archaeon]
MDMKGIVLKPELLKAVNDLGFTELTEIQEKCIPEIQRGADVIGQSSTGSGKTAAFGLPMLEKVSPGGGIQALILTPTRELCVQVAGSLRDFSKHLGVRVADVYGGVSINPQKDALRRCEVVVGTPGRVLDHMRNNSINLFKVRFFVLDETDRMCDMGFYEDVESIIKAVPEKRQTLLFSATMTRDVDRLAGQYMKSPVSIKAGAYVDPALLDQEYYDVSVAGKFSVLVHLLKKNSVGLSMVFCRTRREADVVAHNLKKAGLDALAIHGGLRQASRMRALDSLKSENIAILVATDVAARGLDIKGVNFIYNYDVPPTSEEYIHRIGRTARAGANGRAISLLSPHDHLNFRSVLLNSSLKIRREPTPDAEFIQIQRHTGSRPMHGRPMGGGTGYGFRGRSSGGGHGRGSSHGGRNFRGRGHASGSGYGEGRGSGPRYGPRHAGGGAQGGAFHGRSHGHESGLGPHRRASPHQHSFHSGHGSQGDNFRDISSGPRHRGRGMRSGRR